MNRHRFMIIVLFMFCMLMTTIVPNAVGQITKPESFLGFKPGADYNLANYEQAIAYFEVLAGESDRIIIKDMGPTSMGRRMKYAVISSEENLRNLERYKEIARKLSLARGVTHQEAEQLAEEGKAIVWIDGGLHATEVAPPQHHLQLVYDMVAGEDRKTRLIRENVILLLVFANPDGMTLISEWYMKNVGTIYEVSNYPELYHKYAGHDNNRDSFISNLVETQNMNRATAHEWFPNILFNQHQKGPFPARIWIPPSSEPLNPNVHPRIVRWKTLIGANMGKRFEEAGQSGVISRIRYDAFFQGYATTVVEGHNIPSILTETQLYQYATPRFYTLKDFPEEHRDLVNGVFYPNPWKGGWWRLGDAVAYNITASKAVLEVGAKFSYDLLMSKYEIASEVIEQNKNEPPYGWIIPKDQADNNTAALMLDRLMLNGVEVYTANEEFNQDGITYPEGTFIIPTSQPFGNFVKAIMEKQDFPDLRKYPHLWEGLVSPFKFEGPPLRPYDGVGFTLYLQMGVDGRELSTAINAQMTKIDKVVSPAGTVSGSGSVYVFSHEDNNSFKALNKIQAAGGKVNRIQQEFTLGGKTYSAGAFAYKSNSLNDGKLREIVSETNVSFTGGSVRANTKEIKTPRIALYKSWVASMDAGWMTLIFDNYSFTYHMLTDAEVRAGDLNDRFDVIILPDQRESQIINGHQKGTIPPDYVGGITENGVNNIVKFVKNGGTLICNNGSSGFGINAFKLPVRNVLNGLQSDKFSAPGIIMKMNYTNYNPIAYGMPEEGVAFFSRGQVFEMLPDSLLNDEMVKDMSPEVIAEYPDESLLVSGWMLGDELIRGKASAMNFRIDKGNVVLFGFNVHNRSQAYGTFKLLFNAIFYN